MSKRPKPPSPLGNLLLNYSEGDLFSHHVLPFIDRTIISERIYLVSKRVATLIQNARNIDFVVNFIPEIKKVTVDANSKLFPSLIWFTVGVKIKVSNNKNGLMIAHKIYERAFQSGRKLQFYFMTLEGFKQYMPLFEKYTMDKVRIDFSLNDMTLFRSVIRTISNYRKKSEHLILKQKEKYQIDTLTEMKTIFGLLQEETIFEIFEKVEIALGDNEIMTLILNESNCAILSHLHESIQFKCLKIVLDDTSNDVNTRINFNTQRVVIESTKRNYLPNNFPQFTNDIKFLEMENVRQKLSRASCSTFNLLPNLLHLSHLNLRLCKLNFEEEDLIFDVPKLTTLTIRECTIKVKGQIDDSNKLLKMFKAPLLTELAIENMQLKNVPTVYFPTLKILKLDNNEISESIDLERLRVYELTLLSISFNLILSFQTHIALSKIATKVICLGNVFHAMYINGKLEEFKEEYEVEKSKYYYRVATWINDQNIPKFIRAHTTKLKIDTKLSVSNLISKKQLSGTDPNILFWNFLYMKPKVTENNISTIAGFIQIGIKLNKECAKSLDREWLFIGLYLDTINVSRSVLLDTERFKPSIKYIIENWSAISHQHDHVIKLRKTTI